MSRSWSVLAYHCNMMKVREFLKAVKHWEVSARLPRIASMSGACVSCWASTWQKSDWLFVFAASDRSGSSVRAVNVYFTSSVSLSSAFCQSFGVSGGEESFADTRATCFSLIPAFLHTPALSAPLREAHGRPPPTSSPNYSRTPNSGSFIILYFGWLQQPDCVSPLLLRTRSPRVN